VSPVRASPDDQGSLPPAAIARRDAAPGTSPADTGRRPSRADARPAAQVPDPGCVRRGAALRSPSRWTRAACLLAAAALAGSGCFSARYVAQAACGELRILHEARPISEAATDPRVPARIGRLLLSVRAVKAYARANGLRPTGNYETYADLRRPAAVWVVQACAPLAFDVKRWRFPIVGTIPYLGFFDEGAARAYAQELARQQGLDVDVRVASAFSTLGWFHDPVLSTMIPATEEALGELANVVLHESVHATLYVKDQSAFDESLASFVADRLTLPWLEGVLGRGAPEAEAWAAAQARYQARVARLHRAYLELDALYRSGESDARKLSEKARILGAVQRELRLAAPLNNAQLAGYKTYDTGGPAFERLRGACGGSWPRFLDALATLEGADFGRPQREDFDDVIVRLAAREAARRRGPGRR
jgi:predicted aminopeptidase